MTKTYPWVSKMSDKSPSIDEWNNLYHAAIEFRKLECWNWMWDSDIFGVQNPVSGEIGYCCVMGRLGKHFALGVYLGTEGLEGYLKIQFGEVGQSAVDFLHLQKCLMASFEDRKFLQQQDHQIIKMLGLKFRGLSSWPLFRSHRPGYHPWYLTSDEAKYLTLALQQAVDVSLRFKNNPDMLTPPTGNYCLVRVPQISGAGLRWKDEWLEPTPLEKAKIVAVPIDENRLEGIRRLSSQHRGVWEIDFFYFPRGIREKEERPYYPCVILLVEHYSGFILSSSLTKPTEYKSEIPEQFLKLAESIKYIPNEILVKKEEAFKLLEPITSRIGIKLRKVERLTALEEAQASMREFFIEE